MADTIMSSFREGFTQTGEMLESPQRQKDTTSLLSDRAEASRMKLESEKKAQTTLLASRAALASAQGDSKASITNAEGALKIYGAAVEAAKNNPELQATLLSQQKEHLMQLAQLKVSEGQVRVEKQNQTYDTVKKALLSDNPAELFNSMAQQDPKDENARVFSGLAQFISPSSTLKYPGFNKPYSQLTGDDRQRADQDIERHFMPKEWEKQASNINLEAYRRAEEERKRLADIEKEAIARQKVAADREKAERAKTGKSEADYRKAEAAAMTQRDKEIAAAEKDIAKIKQTYGISEPTETESKGMLWWKQNVSKISNAGDLANFKAAEARVERANKTYQDKIETLKKGTPPTEKASPIVPSSSDKVVGKTLDGKKEVYETKDGKRYTKG
jgi:hypothetical protein